MKINIDLCDENTGQAVLSIEASSEKEGAEYQSLLALATFAVEKDIPRPKQRCVRRRVSHLWTTPYTDELLAEVWHLAVINRFIRDNPDAARLL